MPRVKAAPHKQTNDAALLSLLVSMKDYLVHADGAVRRRAMLLLSELVRRKDLALGSTAGRHLVTFVCDRLADIACVGECVAALATLLRRDDTNAPAIAVALFGLRMRGDGAEPAVPHAVRRAVYELLDALIRAPSVRSIALRIAAGVIECVDGEADPRALLVALRLLGGLAEAFGDELAPLAPALFDVTSCYFPIVFTPPPGSGAITRAQLAGALSAVFASTRAIAALVMPFLLDKLATTVVSAKVDALVAISDCAPVYVPGGGLVPHYDVLRDALMAEAMGDDRSVCEVACACARTLCRAVAAECERCGSGVGWSAFGARLLAAAVEEAIEGDSRSGRGAARMIACVATASEFCFRAVALGPGAALLDAHSKSARPAARAAIVAALADIVHSVDTEVAVVASRHPLRLVAVARDLFLSVLSSRGVGHVMAPASSVAALLGAGDAAAWREGARSAVRGLSDFVVRPPIAVLSELEVSAVVRGLVSALAASDEAVSCAALDALAAIGRKAPVYARLIATEALPPLLSKLQSGSCAGPLRAAVFLAAACASEFHLFLAPLMTATFEWSDTGAVRLSAIGSVVICALARVLPTVVAVPAAVSACVTGRGCPSLVASVVCACVAAEVSQLECASACCEIVRAVLAHSVPVEVTGVVSAVVALFMGKVWAVRQSAVLVTL